MVVVVSGGEKCGEGGREGVGMREAGGDGQWW